MYKEFLKSELQSKLLTEETKNKYRRQLAAIESRERSGLMREVWCKINCITVDQMKNYESGRTQLSDSVLKKMEEISDFFNKAIEKFK